MDQGARKEASEILASARAWLREWADEGIDEYEPPTAVPAIPPDGALATEGRASEAPAARGPGGMSGESAQRRTQPEPGVAPSHPPGPDSPTPATPAAISQTNAAPSSEPSAASELGARPTLELVREELGECTRCKLSEGRQTIVFGDGNPDADLMFIGEGPGEQEDRQGLPFVGRAGDLLTQMIEKGIEIPRRDVYICNIVKCRPPGNRNPLPDEVAACRPFLDGQIDSVQPRVIVTLGKPAASLLLGRDVAITRVRGTWQSYRGIPLMPTLHPAYILRQYTPENRRMVWEDLKAAAARARD